MNEINKKNNHPSPAIIEKFLNNQEKELELRCKELDLQQQSNNNSHEYAIAALQATKEDMEATRNHEATVIKSRHLFAGATLFGLIILVGFALYLNKDQIVLETLKAIILFGSGGLSGYGYAYMRTKKDQEQS
jgi:uncharacterized membrane protein YcjF (UPF0283 family)